MLRGCFPSKHCLLVQTEQRLALAAAVGCSGLGSLGDAGFEDFGSLEEPSLNKLAVLGRAAPSFCCFCY